MPEEAAEDWITVPTAARLLGLRPNSVYRLIERGELEASHGPATIWKRNGQVGERCFHRVSRQAVMDFIERSRVRPGEMRHLLNPDMTAPEISVAKIRRACREQIPPALRDEVRVEATVRGRAVTIWERRPPGHRSAPGWTRMRIAQLRYDPGTGGWLVFTARGRNGWQPYDVDGTAMDLDTAMAAILSDTRGIFFG